VTSLIDLIGMATSIDDFVGLIRENWFMILIPFDFMRFWEW